MMLAVAGPQGLDTLQDWVVPRFVSVKNLNLKQIRFSSKYMNLGKSLPFDAC
ncbi:MAG: hypothetical protein Ct9H300mP28_06260 [Pseudomonadota bacterium]|nr:MAG: hypothetical protein Ct9H300mP28_06260 [Pseudomonadota bacterium]